MTSSGCERLGPRRCDSRTCASRPINSAAKSIVVIATREPSCPHYQIALASVAVGIARGCLEEALRFAQQQSTGAAPILEHQSIQFMLADMATTIDAARLLVRRAAWLADRGDPYEIDAATAKLFASETATKAALDAIQICGSTGYTKDLPVERYLRDAKMLELDAGSSQMQRLDIAQSVLTDE
jgi:alkylation response protein AidB-like acyl-CoA dehydrogenase